MVSDTLTGFWFTLAFPLCFLFQIRSSVNLIEEHYHEVGTLQYNYSENG